MCAPRAVFTSEGTEDPWANPFGTDLACVCAQPVFDFLGVPKNNGFHLREGRHSFCPDDWKALVDFCDVAFGRKEDFAEGTVSHPFSFDTEAYAPWIH